MTFKYRKPRKATGDCLTSELSLELVGKYSSGLLNMELTQQSSSEYVKEVVSYLGVGE
jgi:hypothetical protein